MSVALSNRFQGRRLLSPRCPVPDVPESPPVRAARHARELGGGAWPGRYPRFPADSLSPVGGKAFGLLKARQEKKLEEINRVSRVTARDSVWVSCAILCHPFPQTKSAPSSPIPGLPQLHLWPLPCGLQLQVSPFHPLALCLASPVASCNSLTREVGQAREPAADGQGLPWSPLGTT